MSEKNILKEIELALSELNSLLSEELDESEYKIIQKCIEVIDKKQNEANVELSENEILLLTLSYAIIQKYV